jgi:hypothetical protein
MIKRKSSSWLAIFVALIALVTACDEANIKPFQGGFYGTEEHVYIVDNAYDTATSVRVVAKWDLDGKVKLTSSIIARTSKHDPPGIIVDLPGSAVDYQDSRLQIRESEPTVTVNYDPLGNLEVQPGPVRPLCCYNHYCHWPPGICAWSYTPEQGWQCGGGHCCFVAYCSYPKNQAPTALVILATAFE